MGGVIVSQAPAGQNFSSEVPREPEDGNEGMPNLACLQLSHPVTQGPLYIMFGADVSQMPCLWVWRLVCVVISRAAKFQSGEESFKVV